MNFSLQFIAASREFSTLTDYVPAPYLRKSFSLEALPKKAELTICGLGFYELFVNGKRITKGLLAPYISNPDHILYYDNYDVLEHLTAGENVIGVLLGNGFLNNPGGYVWDFDDSRFRSAPQLAVSLDMETVDGEKQRIEADESFKTAASPIWNDDYRNGEYYDARKEIPGWAAPGFDDSAWQNAIRVPTLRGEARLCAADPLRIQTEMQPVSFKPLGEGYLYDFGVNFTGFCRLSVNAKAGQEISVYYGEHLLPDGTMNRRNLGFDENDYVQKDIYICKDGAQEYTPSFTYHGFQYVYIKGLLPEQATAAALTYLVFHSDLAVCGGFTCSDETVNKLQELTRRSDLSNFFYFPTDCPHREKNGWTGDAAVSAEHMLLNLKTENSYREWLHNIRKAQAEDGSLPGIVPTGDWGYHWGNGPAWDCVLTFLPYYTYIYRGDKTILEENAMSILRYLTYIDSKIREDGLLAYGLGDWCPPARGADHYKSPIEFTDTVICMDICSKAAYIFGELGQTLQRDFAQGLHDKIFAAARRRLINTNTMTARGNCQTSQAMAIYHNLFLSAEKPQAARVLAQMIEEYPYMDVGILGARAIFHVLSEFGYTDLALKLITQPVFPSYGWWIAEGATSLWEDFHTDRAKINSHNHHFWGDISHWFIRHLAGIHYNPQGSGNEVDIRPQFAEALDFAEGCYQAPAGEIRVRWEREGEKIKLTVKAPLRLDGVMHLPQGYVFEDGVAVKELESEEFTVVKEWAQA